MTFKTLLKFITCKLCKNFIAIEAMNRKELIQCSFKYLVFNFEYTKILMCMYCPFRITYFMVVCLIIDLSSNSELSTVSQSSEITEVPS